MIETIITSSVLILIIIALRYLLRGRISSRLQYALWALVAVRLLLPFSLFESPVSVMNAIPNIQSDYSAVKQPVDSVNSRNNVLPSNNSPILQSGHEISDSSAGTANPVNGEAIARFVWLSGLILSGVLFGASNIRLSRNLRRIRKRIEFPQYPLPVYVADGLPSPCLYGIRKPAVYVTPESLSDEKRIEYVVAHELTHYRQKDHIWSFVRILCLCVHWFNPLVWIAVVLSRRDSELACDEGTLRRIGPENRMEYGRTLIEMMTSPSKPSDLFCYATTMAGSKGEMTERIKRIAKQPKTLMITLTIVVVVALAAVALTFGGAARNVPVVLPDTSAVTSITIEQINEGESLGKVHISQKSDLEAVLSALSDTDKTLRQSVNDTPNRDNYFQIDIESTDARRFYLYNDDKKYYLEEPYAGIYRTNRITSATIAKVYAPKGRADQSINAQELWDARTLYVGDNSSVGTLLGLLPLSEGLWHDHFALHTADNERSIEWVLQGDDTASYEGSTLHLNALLLFALVDNLQDFYITMKDSEQDEPAFHYDRTWADEIAGRDVREYAESPEKLQELLDLFGSESTFAQYNIAKLGKNGEILDGYFLVNQQLALAIINDYMVKSAVWEGVDIMTLEECYLIRQIFPESLETHDYYAYLREDGTAVLQSGTDGRYSVLSPELYSELVKAIETLSTDSWLENKYTEGAPRPDFDNMVWMATDDEKGYCTAFYQDVSREQIEQYLKTLEDDGWQTIRDLYEHTKLGGRYQKNSHTISIQFYDDQEIVIYFS
ncbi:Methicillin resistance mecR1 protein [compost metagenome]